ncbi:uncharacterized protein LOC112612877 isoform X1 [Theropithecus gelada]|uniref:uncharacterized protein LOC112612877 isoform X1 n=1 Tax=Theropithecus gelada TaxID=9565 RepID=UPI000DC17A20|nr:uncharacterized protein LOC112612877 isoform X1 [Theropithecus gelada]
MGLGCGLWVTALPDCPLYLFVASSGSLFEDFSVFLCRSPHLFLCLWSLSCLSATLFSSTDFCQSQSWSAPLRRDPPSASLLSVTGSQWPLHSTLAERPPQVLAARGHPPWHGAENSWLGSSQRRQVPRKPAVRGGAGLRCRPAFQPPAGHVGGGLQQQGARLLGPRGARAWRSFPARAALRGAHHRVRRRLQGRGWGRPVPPLPPPPAAGARAPGGGGWGRAAGLREDLLSRSPGGPGALGGK